MVGGAIHRRLTRLPPLPSIGEVIRVYQLEAKKQLSQNFLLDMNLARKIVRKGGRIKAGVVCEVGPGPGGLTRAILEENVTRLDVIEKDRRFLPGLELLADASGGRLRVIEGDALKYDFGMVWPLQSTRTSWYDALPNCHLIGNLPFNIASPLIMRWLRQMSERSGPFVYGRTPMTLTFQKEVAQRIVAPIDGAHRCRLSAMAQAYADVKHVFTIPGANFVPAPQVDVGVVHLVPLEEPLIPLPFELVNKFCRHLFHYRQKYGRKPVATLFPEEFKNNFTDEIFRRCRVNPTLRCIELGMEEIRDMCFVYEEQCRRIPGLFLYDYRAKHQAGLDELAKQDGALPEKYGFAVDIGSDGVLLDEFGEITGETAV